MRRGKGLRTGQGTLTEVLAVIKFHRLVLLCLCTALTAQAGAAWPDPPAATPRTEPLEIRVHFPGIPFDGSVDHEAAAKVDQAIAQAVEELVVALLPYGSVFGSYEIDFDEGPLLSVTLTYSGYRFPMAHPMHHARSLTFDLHTGRLLTLDDLFTGDYLAALSGHIAAQIAATDLPLLRPFDGIDASADFRLTPEGVVIYFQLYDLAPYAWGFPQFLIPYADVAEFIADPYRKTLLETVSHDGPQEGKP